MSNIIKAHFLEESKTRLQTEPLFQYDYGQVLDLSEIEGLPAVFEAHFCNKGDASSTAGIGTDGQVTIPDAYLQTGKYIYIYVYLHTGESDGETEYKITVPVAQRASVTHEEPTPVQQSEIEQLMAALEAGIAAAEGAVEHYPQIIDGMWWVWSDGQFVDSGIRAEGVSPTATVERVEGGARITITDESGTTSALVQDGKVYIDALADTLDLTVGGGWSEVTEQLSVTWTNGKYINPRGEIKSSSNYAYTSMIHVEEGQVLSTPAASIRYATAYDDNEEVVYEKGKGSGTLFSEYGVPSGVAYVVLSVRSAATGSGVFLEKQEYVDPTIKMNQDFLRGVRYVAADGNDENDGLTASRAMATVNAALESGGRHIVLASGVYEQTINLAYVKYGDFTMQPQEINNRVIFRPGNCIAAESATAVSGYTKVYSFPLEYAFAANNIYIFQDGVADEGTEILAEERHPLQRGYRCRCEDTAIRKTTATTLSDALPEIEASEAYKWYSDGTTVYLSCPETVSASHPICISRGGALFTGANRSITLNLTGIESKYQRINVNNTCASILRNCKCTNVYGDGCFTFNGALAAEFRKCEAARGFNGTNGDGFNGHSGDNGDPFAYQTNAVFIDCWAHDNRDDGSSDHERCESTYIGGLYEYNGYGAGVTPSYGSHTTCNGVYSRKNGDGGFMYSNSAPAAEGGVGGQMICYGCVAENNNTWAGHAPAGFDLRGSNNRAILVNCASIGNPKGFNIESASSLMTLINSSSLNCSSDKEGQVGNYTVLNGGISPTIDVSTISGGHRITITDSSGTESFDVLDGEVGEPGVGVPTGGDTGSVLVKTGSGDYWTGWRFLAASDVGAVDLNDLPFNLGATLTFVKDGIRATNGETYSSSTVYHTGYVDVSGFAAIVYTRLKTENSTSTYCSVAFYDENKTFVSAIRPIYNDVGGTALEHAEIPSGVVYARFCMFDSNRTYFRLYDESQYSTALKLMGIAEAGSGGGCGTSDYDQLSNRPQINGVTLTGNKTAAQLGLGTYSKPSGGIPASDIASGVIPPAYTLNPAALGTASPGSSTSWARGDHVHPKPTYSASDVGALPTAGGTMSGAINMGSGKITNLADGSADGDAVNFGQMASAISGKITAPSSPASGAFLVWDGSAWTAQTLAVWQGGSY